MHVNSTLSVYITDFLEPEGQTVTVIFEEIVNTVAQIIPSFAAANGINILFNPVPFSTLGVHTFKVTISDS